MDAATRDRLVKDMTEAAFVLETVAYLKRLERELLPVADSLREGVEILKTEETR